MSGLPVGFALARVHARHADRPTAAEWRRLDGARTAAQYLQIARRTGLKPWLRGVAEEDPQQVVELKLRAAFRRHVAEVAGWLPAEHRPAARWIARLVDLPALAHLHAGRPPQPWMDDDPVLAPFLDDPPASPPFAEWLGRWRTLWPGPRRDPLAGRLGTALRDTAVPGRADAAAARLHWLFRTRVADAGGVAAYLGLVLDDLRRLAGGLARRRPGERRHLEAA
ncbi:MAG: hypothetical protein R3298_09895 [Gammaproteobacteria bacterium]|nr:hypothetical protein [Gammaproteobacteria bacterium]